MQLLDNSDDANSFRKKAQRSESILHHHEE